jgi:beta-fructofuranosidase
MRQFEYHFTIGPPPYFGKMAECPDLLFFPEGDVLLVSSIGLPQEGGQYRNVNSSLALIGRFDLPNRYYEIDAFHELDKGHAFYAPQATKTPQGDYVMTAWMNIWAKPYYPAMQQHMWSGSLVLPRLVSIKDKRLVQTPINALERYHKPLAFNENSLIRKAFDLH